MQARQENYLVSNDASKLDKDFVVKELQATYWANTRSREAILQSLENSLCYGLYLADRQIGFGRVITDFVTHAYLCDVVITEEFRGQGLGEFLVGTILEDERLAIARFALFTKDAQEFYKEKFGFALHKFETLVREPRKPWFS